MLDRAQQLGFIVQRISTAQQNQSILINRVLAPYELSLAKLDLLLQLSRQSHLPWSVKRLVEVLHLNQPKVTKMLKSLLVRGLISVETDQSDARQKNIEITQAGRNLSQLAYEALSPVISGMFEGYSTENLKQFANQLEKFCQQARFTKMRG